jgi:hypothetical protein
MGAIEAQIFDWIGKALVGIIISAIIATANRIRRRRSRRAIVEAITGLNPEKLPLAVVGTPLRARPGSTELTQQRDGLPVFGYGPFVSYAAVANRLLEGKGRGDETSLPQIVLGSQFDQLSENDKRDRDLILIGYPAGNEASRILEPLMKLPVRFAELPDRGLILNETGAKLVAPSYVSTGGDTSRTVYDYGLVARVKHPLNPEKNILYLAGCETFGVKIGAESLRMQLMPQTLGLGKFIGVTWRYRWLPTLGLSRARNTEWVAIFGASVEYLATGFPRLIYGWIRTADQTIWRQIESTDRTISALTEGSLQNTDTEPVTHRASIEA